MKLTTTTTLLLTIMLFFCIPSQAAFWHSKKAETAATTPSIKYTRQATEMLSYVSPANTIFSKFSDHDHDGKPKDAGSGWEGIVSLMLGIVSFFSLVTLFGAGSVVSLFGAALSIPALILGIIGLKKKNKGMALAGLIVGGVTALFLLLIVLILALVIAAWGGL